MHTRIPDVGEEEQPGVHASQAVTPVDEVVAAAEHFGAAVVARVHQADMRIGRHQRLVIAALESEIRLAELATARQRCALGLRPAYDPLLLTSFLRFRLRRPRPLGLWFGQRIDCVRQLLDLGLGELVVGLESIAFPLSVEQRMHRRELGRDLAIELRILVLEQRVESVEAYVCALDVAWKSHRSLRDQYSSSPVSSRSPASPAGHSLLRTAAAPRWSRSRNQKLRTVPGYHHRPCRACMR